VRKKVLRADSWMTAASKDVTQESCLDSCSDRLTSKEFGLEVRQQIMAFLPVKSSAAGEVSKEGWFSRLSKGHPVGKARQSGTT
jgi:hypothetical protein